MKYNPAYAWHIHNNPELRINLLVDPEYNEKPTEFLGVGTFLDGGKKRFKPMPPLVFKRWCRENDPIEHAFMLYIGHRPGYLNPHIRQALAHLIDPEAEQCIVTLPSTDRGAIDGVGLAMGALKKMKGQTQGIMYIEQRRSGAMHLRTAESVEP